MNFIFKIQNLLLLPDIVNCKKHIKIRPKEKGKLIFNFPITWSISDSNRSPLDCQSNALAG